MSTTESSSFRDILVRYRFLPLFAVSLILIGLIIVRSVIEGVFLLPAPVGDRILFLDPAHNFCNTGFLGTDLVNLDPQNQHRFVWHGFLSPWLLSKLNFSCSIPGFYWVGLAIKGITLFLAFFVARAWGLPKWQAVAISLLAFAIQSKLGFRPELLAIAWIFAIELVIIRRLWNLAACLAVLLLFTQPMVFGLYGLLFLIHRPTVLMSALNSINILCFLIAFATLAIIYPFPLLDLAEGLRLHAAYIFSRGGGELATYYGATHFAPFWAFLFVAALLILMRRRPLLILLLPFLYWFGPRVPPTHYNLLAIFPLIVVLGIAHSGKTAAILLTLGALVVGGFGLAQLSIRDIATILKGPGYMESYRLFVADIQSSSFDIGDFPGFGSLWLREQLQNSASPPNLKSDSGNNSFRVDYYAMSGRPISPCPDQSPNAEGYYLSGVKVINSTSGWGTYRCVRD